jgi:ribokinase
MSAPIITVLGSVNLDLVAHGQSLPRPGQTVTGARFATHPGGKGANQALAAKRLGAEAALVACVGKDETAPAALALLKDSGVDLSGVQIDEDLPTGVALICVAQDGENQIMVAPGANQACPAAAQNARAQNALICQLEVPIEAIATTLSRWTGFVALNLAPAIPVPQSFFARADLLVVNETEAAFYGEKLHSGPGLVALTLGAAGAELYQNGQLLCAARPPPVTPLDTTGAGDTFVGALVVALSDGQNQEAALRFACAAGALATTRPGAQPSMPVRAEVEALLD